LRVAAARAAARCAARDFACCADSAGSGIVRSAGGSSYLGASDLNGSTAASIPSGSVPPFVGDGATAVTVGSSGGCRTVGSSSERGRTDEGPLRRRRELTRRVYPMAPFWLLPPSRG
jgi:hypothetical protein